MQIKLESHQKEERKENIETEGYLNGSYSFRRTTNNLVVKSGFNPQILRPSKLLYLFRNLRQIAKTPISPLKSPQQPLYRLEFFHNFDVVGFDEEVEEVMFAFYGIADSVMSLRLVVSVKSFDFVDVSGGCVEGVRKKLERERGLHRGLHMREIDLENQIFFRV